MSGRTEEAANMRAPTSARRQRLSGTGSTEDGTSTALDANTFATLLVGDTAVRVEWINSSPGGSDVNATTSVLLDAYARIDWVVTTADQHVAMEADDGSSDYEAFVWNSSPGMG